MRKGEVGGTDQYELSELRLSVPDFVSQLWRKRQNLGWKAWVQIFFQSRETKSRTESLDLRLGLANNRQCVCNFPKFFAEQAGGQIQ